MKTSLRSAAFVLAFALIAGHASPSYASGYNSNGVENVIGAGGATLITLNSLTTSAVFTADAIFNAQTGPAVFNWNGTGDTTVVRAIGNQNFGASGLTFQASGRDAGLSTVTWDGVWHHVIGTYSGWDPGIIYVAGYNASNSLQNTTAVEFGGWGFNAFTGQPAPGPAAHVDLVNRRLGVNTVTPSKTLDVSGTANISGDTNVGGFLNVNGEMTLNGTPIMVMKGTVEQVYCENGTPLYCRNPHGTAGCAGNLVPTCGHAETALLISNYHYNVQASEDPSNRCGGLGASVRLYFCVNN